MQNGINFYEVFTETGPGKGSVDGVGTAIKNICKDTIAYNSDAVIWNTDQLLKYLPQSENIIIGKYTDIDVQFCKSIFPIALVSNVKILVYQKCMRYILAH